MAQRLKTDKCVLRYRATNLILDVHVEVRNVVAVEDLVAVVTVETVAIEAETVKVEADMAETVVETVKAAEAMEETAEIEAETEVEVVKADTTVKAEQVEEILPLAQVAVEIEDAEMEIAAAVVDHVVETN